MSVYVLPLTRSIARVRTRYKDCPKVRGEHIKDAQDCWSNSRALCEKFSAHRSEARTHTHLKRAHTHIWSARTHTSEAHAHTHLKRTHTHIWSTRTDPKCAHTHIWSARTDPKRAHTHTSEARAHTHTSEAHAHRQPRQLCVNTKLSSPLLFWAWMNKFRQNYIKMHVLANILVNSRLRKACVLM